jgi:hypothetical protein
MHKALVNAQEQEGIYREFVQELWLRNIYNIDLHNNT